MTKSKTYRASKTPAPPTSASAKSIVLQLAPEVDDGQHAFSLERDALRYSPDVTLPFAYTSDCKFTSMPEELPVTPADAAAPAEAALESLYGEKERSREASAETGERFASRVTNVLHEFETKSATGDWPVGTNVACYWCCSAFDTPPVGLPVRCGAGKGGDTFVTTGCFCSLACAAAFNQNSCESNNVKCGRHSMINAMSMAAGQGAAVRVAPPREVLAMFGGYASPAEFRKMSGEPKVFLHSMPPMRFVSMQIEEVNNTNVSAGFRERMVPLDAERIERCITLRRTKPLLDYKNTLDHSMRLTITQTPTPPVH